MKKIIEIIVILVIVGILGYMAYKFIFKKPANGTPCSSTGGSINDGIIVDGNCIKNTTSDSNTLPTPDQENININPDITSPEVHYSAVSTAQNPSLFLVNISESNMSSFNLTKAPGSNPSRIHIVTKFNTPCAQFVWYKHWLYVLSSSKADQNTGLVTCYYKIDKSVFPDEIKVSTQVGSKCNNFKLFFSGVEYRYSDTRIEHPNNFTTLQFCAYKKQ